jgi:hypothetical protein
MPKMPSERLVFGGELQVKSKAIPFDYNVAGQGPEPELDLAGQSKPRATGTKPKTMSMRATDMAGLLRSQDGLWPKIGHARPPDMETMVPEWKRDLRGSEHDATRATARLPGLDIDIVHNRSPEGEWEQISINLRATPSFEAFGRAFEVINPFTFWAYAARLTWLPWLLAAQTMLPPSSTRFLSSKDREQ